MKHDEIFARLNFNDPVLVTPPWTNSEPFDQTDETLNIAQVRQMYEQYYSEVEDNFIPQNIHWKDLDVSTRLQFFLRKETKTLCQGTVSFELEHSGAIIVVVVQNKWLILEPIKFLKSKSQIKLLIGT